MGFQLGECDAGVVSSRGEKTPATAIPLPELQYLYEANAPQAFWRLMRDPLPTVEEWTAAIDAASTSLPPSAVREGTEITVLLGQILGEGQFGSGHWNLGLAKRIYYQLKPLLPRGMTRIMRQIHAISAQHSFPLRWPIEDRYARFQWEIVRQLLNLCGDNALEFVYFWPHGHQFAFALTHDIETAEGQAAVRMVADLEEELGYRSSFNFVPERYELDHGLMGELRARGFEIGVHGLTHDGRLFSSRGEFMRRAARINEYLKELDAVGFRAPLTHRHPEWMQALEIEYDSSFFDTDPFEPIPGGTMSIWPFQIGRFVELPYTLPQDYTLTAIMREKTSRVWLQKVKFIKDHYGMALVNTHPDYLKAPEAWRVYEGFLHAIRRMGDYWNALPRDIARWWQARATSDSVGSLPGAVRGVLKIAALNGLDVRPMRGSISQRSHSIIDN